MRFLDALVKAKTDGYSCIWRESKPWITHGIRTIFSEEDQRALDWRVGSKGKSPTPSGAKQ